MANSNKSLQDPALSDSWNKNILQTYFKQHIIPSTRTIIEANVHIFQFVSDVFYNAKLSTNFLSNWRPKCHVTINSITHIRIDTFGNETCSVYEVLISNSVEILIQNIEYHLILNQITDKTNDGKNVKKCSVFILTLHFS